MDWTKAKSILLVALLITNLIIGMAYYGKIREANSKQIAAVQSVQTYLRAMGITLDVEIPSRILKKPVLFVQFQPPVEGQENDPVYYDGMLVEASKDNTNIIVPLSYGETKRDVLGASYALLKFISYVQPEESEKIRITGIELVYWVSASGSQANISEDTAVPTWKISTADGQSYYINAYEE